MNSVKIANQQLPLFQGIQPTQTAVMLNCLRGYTQKYSKNDLISMSKELGGNSTLDQVTTGSAQVLAGSKQVSLGSEPISADTKQVSPDPDQVPAGKIGIVLSGTVHVYQKDLWGNPCLLNYLGPGELFGESLALFNGPDSHLFFVAASKCEILFLSSRNVLHPCHHNCPFHRRMIENLFYLLSLKNQRLMEQIEISSQKTLRDKILAYLSREAQLNNSMSFTIALSRTQLADYLCANRSALYRELNAMEDDGLITTNGRQFTLHDNAIHTNQHPDLQ